MNKKRFVNVKTEEVQIQEGSEEVQYIPVSCITEATHARNKNRSTSVITFITDYILTKNSFKICVSYEGDSFDHTFSTTNLSDWEFFKKEVKVQKPVTQTKYIIEMDENSAVVLRDILGKLGLYSHNDAYPALRTLNTNGITKNTGTLYDQLYTLLRKNRSQT
jgi:hypothetical protein